jgi:hypothetical protein
MTMTFNWKALLIFVAFAVVVLLAVDARLRPVGIGLAFAGAVAVLVIELLTTVGPLARSRRR